MDYARRIALYHNYGHQLSHPNNVNSFDEIVIKKILATELLNSFVIFFYLCELNYLIKHVSLIPDENFVPIYPYLIIEGRRNCSSL